MNKILTIIGPTAVGKTKLAIDIAKHLNGEVIGLDSRQIYKEISIGTAKPSKINLKKIKHHFINHVSIHDDFNVGIFHEQANKILESLFKKINTVVMVGGSGLYADSIIYGIDHFPKVKASVKKQVISLFKNEGLQKLNSMLREHDPEYYRMVDKNNARRVIRALEVCLSSGKPFISFFKEKRRNNLFKTKILLMDSKREELYKKINKRVDKMISLGLEKEAKEVYKYRNLNSLQTVGYKEFFDYFNEKFTYKFTIDEIKKNTRRYAKRQTTWNKKYKEVFLVKENYKLNEILNFINN